MPKITVEVPENCYYCKLRDRHMCNYFSKRVEIPFTEDTFERCPECLASEVKEPKEEVKEEVKEVANVEDK